MHGGYVQNRQKKSTEERLPPYVSHRAWQRFLGELSKHTPSRFDSSYFDALKMTKSTRSMLQGSLLFFDLMSPDGYPTEKLHQLVKLEGEARRAALAETIKGGYGPLFTKLDLTCATQGEIKEYFRSRGASGDIGRKCISFFVAISTEANITLSPHLKKSTPRIKGRKTVSVDLTKPKGTKMVNTGGSIDWEKMLLEKFPNFNPEWPDDIKKKWFDAFRFLKRTLETSIPRRKTSSRR